MNPVCVWQVVAVHPDSVKFTFNYLNQMGHSPHFVWNPFNGDLIECIPLDEAGTLFSRSVNQAGSPLVQIAVVAERETPFTSSLLSGFEKLSEALKGVGVPSLWPKGPPTLTGHLRGVQRGSIAAGHYSIDQLDPSFFGTGPIDTGRLHYD